MKLEKVELKRYIQLALLDFENDNALKEVEKLRKEVKQMKRRAFWMGIMFYVYKIIGFKCENIKLKTK